jgi:hypothetical protein
MRSPDIARLEMEGLDLLACAESSDKKACAEDFDRVDNDCDKDDKAMIA